MNYREIGGKLKGKKKDFYPILTGIVDILSVSITLRIYEQS